LTVKKNYLLINDIFFRILNSVEYNIETKVFFLEKFPAGTSETEMKESTKYGDTILYDFAQEAENTLQIIPPDGFAVQKNVVEDMGITIVRQEVSTLVTTAEPTIDGLYR